jgi:hypothetical protein
MNIVIRGHIRNAFETGELYEFLKHITDRYNIKIFIHTWDKKQNTLSWRNIEEDSTPITTEFIRSYFKDIFVHVKKIIIETDSDIKLYGNTEGKLASSRTSLLGWKRYAYGQHRIIKHIYDSVNITEKNNFLLNIRFDLFTNSYVFPFEEITNFIKNNYNNQHRNNKFLREGDFCGIDNIIIGSIESQYMLISKIHLCLDYILEDHRELQHPEFIFRIVHTTLCQ